LERGDKEEYFVPLAGRNVGEEFVLEVRYTVPGDHRRLDLPQFPGDPAVQKVCLCAYVPEELTVLGSRGPWTDEMSWHWYEMRNGWPRPIQSDVELVGWVIEGLNLPTNPAADFATDGRLYTFSTLEPPPPPDGSLRLVVLRRTTLHVIVFVVVMLGGLLAIRRSLPAKLALAVLLLVVLLILSVFLPAFTRQIMDGALYIAVAVVLAIWFLWHVAWAVVALSAAQKTRREQKAESGEPKAESGEPRAESQTPKAEGEEVKAPEKEGESPFASPSQPEASKPPEAGSDASPSDASSKPQEGGPSHA
jgi:hypothetical protein